MEYKKCYCPKCGSENLQTVVKTNSQTYGKDFSFSKGCCGAFLFGPIGILCGACGKGKQIVTTNTTLFACNDCGYEFKKRKDLVNNVINAEKNKNFIVPLVMFIFLVIFMIITCFVMRNSDMFLLAICVEMLSFGISGLISSLIWKQVLENAQNELNEYDKKQEFYENLKKHNQ